MDPKEMDVYELMVYLKDHPLPEDTDKRMQVLSSFLSSPYLIIYEDIIRYSRSFAAVYPQSRIRDIMRRFDIRGYDLFEEINTSHMTEEEKMLLHLFFRGKVGKSDEQ